MRLFLIIGKTINKPFLASHVSTEMSDVHIVTELCSYSRFSPVGKIN